MNIRCCYLLVTGLIVLLLGPVQSSAVLIDFDDLPTQVDASEHCADLGPGYLCVDNQYQSLGITFAGPMLYSTPQGSFMGSPPNAVVDWAGPGISIQFAENVRPSYVSFDAWTYFFGGVYAWAYNGADELIDYIEVESDATYPKDGYWTTLEPTNIALSAPEIKRIEIEALYHRRGNLHMDNVYFGSAPPTDVSEPPAAALLMLVSMAMLLKYRRKKLTSNN